MTVSYANAIVQWPTTGNTATVASGATVTSNAFVLGTTAFQWVGLILYATLVPGSASSDDTVDFYILGSADGTNFVTTGGRKWLERLTVENETPQRKRATIDSSLKEFKIEVKNNSAADSITVQVDVSEKRQA